MADLADILGAAAIRYWLYMPTTSDFALLPAFSIDRQRQILARAAIHAPDWERLELVDCCRKDVGLIWRSKAEVGRHLTPKAAGLTPEWAETRPGLGGAFQRHRATVTVTPVDRDHPFGTAPAHPAVANDLIDLELEHPEHQPADRIIDLDAVIGPELPQHVSMGMQIALAGVGTEYARARRHKGCNLG